MAMGVVVAVCLAIPAVGHAQTISFGANLSRAPDNPTPCNAFFGHPTCSVNFSSLTGTETGFPPVGRGVITRVRVRVGPVTGPMQVVVEQALRADNPASPGKPTYACCQAIRTSQVFTPAPNAITAVNVNLPVRQDIAPDPQTGYYVDQHLALSILAPNVPIPAATNPNGAYNIWFPAWAPGDERCCPYGGTGATVLMNADWRRCSAAAASAGAEAAARKKKPKKSACGKRKKKKRKKG